MRVVYFMRRPRHGQNHSVENIVDGIVATLGREFQAVRAVSRFESLGVWPRLYNIVEAAFRQGDVNHVTGDVNFLAYLLDRRRTVLTILDCGRIAGKRDWRKRIVKLFWFTIPVRRADVITVISHAVKAELLTHVRIEPGKVEVVPVAVPSLYRRVDKAFAELPTILQVGTAPNKNLPRLAQALAGIPCRLRIVGVLTPEQRELLAAYKIEFENYVGISNEQLVALYGDSDIVAFPSTFEGFGMPIIEGNLVGRPVVAGNAASIPEVAGSAACLVDPFDVASIREGFLRVIQDPAYRAELVERGFANATRYQQRAITSQYEAIYHRLAQRRPRRASRAAPEPAESLSLGGE
jgi:glycosyltransferase involved in cell wall biosynthesis